MRKTTILFFILCISQLYVWGDLYANDSPGPDPNPNPNGGGRMSATARELPHERFVKQGASKLFEALAYINIVYARFEVGERIPEFFNIAEPLLEEAAELFKLASQNISVPQSTREMYRNYQYYRKFRYSTKYPQNVMQNVCYYFSRGDFEGFHAHCAKEILAIKKGIQKAKVNMTANNMRALTHLTQCHFGKCGTALARIIESRK